MGNPRKPDHLKVVAGTDQPCRRQDNPVELPLVAEIPEPPTWLPNAHAKLEFERLAPILFNNKLLTEGGVSALAQLCALHGKIVQMWAAGEAPTGHMMAQYRALTNDFGLTPVAQGKVRPGGKDDSGNPYGNRPQKPKAPAKKTRAKKRTK